MSSAIRVIYVTYHIFNSKWFWLLLLVVIANIIRHNLKSTPKKQSIDKALTYQNQGRVGKINIRMSHQAFVLILNLVVVRSGKRRQIQGQRIIDWVAQIKS